MEGLDIFATKGAEYLFCGGFLLVLVVFWKLLNPSGAAARAVVAAARPPAATGGWFQLPEGFYFHQGHAWASPEEPGVVRVGIDDFAQKLLGRPAGFVLPAVGTRLAQGERAWQVQVDGHVLPMLAPVDGEVVAINPQVGAAPELINADPYDRGWLMKVKVAHAGAVTRNLLSGGVARAWMDGLTERLRGMHVGELGIVMPDGGVPVSGFARALSPDGWDRMAREFLLSG